MTHVRTWFRRLRREDEGVLSFEWILLLTLLVIGIVGGIAGVRDAIITELADVAEAAISIDQSFSMPGDPDLGIPDSSFIDSKPAFTIERTPLAEQQELMIDS